MGVTRGSVDVLRMEGVTFAYRPGGPDTVSGVDLKCGRGEVVGLIGPNGAGKTTLLKLAAGLLRPASGRVTVAGREMASLGRRDAARLAAYVPPFLHTAFGTTARDLVALGRVPHLRGVFESARDRLAVSLALERVGAGDLSERSYAELSAGEQRRVVVARALAQEPALLLLDEPTANLDIAHGLRLLSVLRKTASERGTAVLAAIHDLNLALLFCDRLYLLGRGSIVAGGEPEDVMRYTLVREVFGCDVYIGRNEVNGKLFMVPMDA